MNARTSRRLACITALALMALPSLCSAQGILIPERPDVREQPFFVKSVRVSATISDTVAETTVEQSFYNGSPVDQEGTYLFPLPEGATVTSFSLKAGDRVLEGRLLGKDEARGVYESIVRRRRDPALLEYAGRGLFRSSVFPIPARSERVLTLKYAQVLRLEGGLKRYSYPLSTGRFSSRPIDVASIMLKLRTTAPLKTVYSPTHDVSIRRPDDNTATASWEGRGEFPDRDFTLFYSTSSDDVGLSLLTYKSGDRDGYFMLVAAPRVTVPRERVMPKQIVFVLDRTGSMQANGKIDQAKAALRYCLENLQPQDRFNVMTFNESPDILFRSLVPASAENVKKALRFTQEIDASGGTNIDEALRSGLGLLRDAEGTQKMCVFLTDGLPTVGETNTETILANVRRLNGSSRVAAERQSAGTLLAASLTRGTQQAASLRTISLDAAPPRARIFCFGVGYDVNVPFLDRLAEESRAEADYVRPNESIESIVSAFYSKITSPILANVKLTFEGAEVYDVYPKELPDLFKGSQLVISGRYRGDPTGGVRLTGTAQERPASFVLAHAFGESAARSGLIPRIWAARKIGYLLDQVRLHSNQEVVDEIVRLSKEYGILTPYTSYLADERNDRVQAMSGFGGGGRAYDLSQNLLERQQADARRDLLYLATPRGDGSGQAETYRSLNSKGYQGANRAPTGAQGPASGPGMGGGGLGGFGGGLGGGFGAGRGRAGELPREKIGLDYSTATDAAKKPNQEGYKQIQAGARVQAVAGRVFYKRGSIWFDNAYPSGRKVVQVKALSEAHFQLLHAVPGLNRYAAVGDEVVIDLGKTAVQIGAEGKEKLSEAELKELTAK